MIDGFLNAAYRALSESELNNVCGHIQHLGKWLAATFWPQAFWFIHRMYAA